MVQMVQMVQMVREPLIARLIQEAALGFSCPVRNAWFQRIHSP